MKKLYVLLAAAALFALPLDASAGNRIEVYPSQNPSSVQVNQQPRFDRLTLGDYLRDAFGPIASTYGNLTVAPGTGLYVTVAPLIAGSQGTVYQIGPDDPNPIPVGFSPNLPADTTPIMLEGTTAATSAPLGPLTAPGAGLSIYYLIEAQVQTVDSNPQTLTFVNSSGQPYTQTLDTQRSDQVVYQFKTGTAGASPTVPATDSGWVPIGTVLVPSGVSQITSAMIAQANPCGPGSGSTCVAFSGFVQSAYVAHVYPNPSPTPDVGYGGVTGTWEASQLVSTAPNGTAPLQVISSTLVPFLHAAVADALDTILPIAQGGTGTASPVGVIPGSSGNFTCSGAIFSPGQTCDVVASPSFTTVTASTMNATNAAVSGLPSLPCIGTNASGQLQAGSCGSGGSLTINGTAPITATQSAGIATIACPSCALLTGNTYSGSETIAPAGTATSATNYASAGAFALQNSTWNGSAAVTNSWAQSEDTLGNLIFNYNGTRELTLTDAGALEPATPLGVAYGGSGVATLAASPFVVLNPSTAQSGAINVTGNVQSGGSFLAGSSTYGPTGATVNGALRLPATSTATSTNNYPSNILSLNNSVWTGSAAGTNGWNLFTDTSGNLTGEYNGSLGWQISPAGGFFSTTGYTSRNSFYGPTGATVAGPATAATSSTTMQGNLGPCYTAAGAACGASYHEVLVSGTVGTTLVSCGYSSSAYCATINLAGASAFTSGGTLPGTAPSYSCASGWVYADPITGSSYWGTSSGPDVTISMAPGSPNTLYVANTGTGDGGSAFTFTCSGT